jgi:D-threo-aldose 1-dehydrogenase
VRGIKDICDRHGVPLAAAALQFPLAHPTVAAVIPGPRNVDEFETNVKLLRHPIPAALWADLRAADLLHPEAPTPA